MDLDLLDRAIVARIPVLVKARAPEASGRRIVECEASTEEQDLDGDVVLQAALLGSAASFVATGHLDMDHKSELGHRMVPPIRDPESYIVGRPLDVRAASGGRTYVEGEISRSADGTDDPARSHADAFWASLRRDPPVLWYASIYGFPIDLDDCTRGECAAGVAAKRFVIKAIDWRSLAFTRTPKNTALKGEARIVSAKAYIAELAKSIEGPPMSALLAVPQTMDDVYAASDCLGCRVQDFPSLTGYRGHFEKCAKYPAGLADIAAHAVMHRRNMQKAFDRAFGRNKDGVLK
jgi:hypothetical protein